jgi:hypothetical protein
MSYCRWSSDDFACDLYCYEDVSGGWTTHVASNKPVGEIPKIDHLFDELVALRDDAAIQEKAKEYAAASKARDAWFDTCERRPLGLPYDGQSFNDSTLEDFKARLIHLREVGYRFPDDVLTDVDEEIAEAGAQ